MTSHPISAASRPPCAVLTPGLPVLRRSSPGNPFRAGRKWNVGADGPAASASAGDRGRANPFSPETATRAARSITPNESSPHEVGRHHT